VDFLKGNTMNISTENKGQWFYFDESNPDEGGVCIRELSVDELERIESITVKTHKKVKHGVAYDETRTDDKLAKKMRWDYCIVDWKNVVIDGASADCTSENKQKAVKSMAFLRFILSCLEKLNDEAEISNEARLKNSETS